MLKVCNNIPTTLTQTRAWVLWQFKKKNDKLTKVPLKIDGSYAKTNDPSTWEEFFTVVSAYEADKLTFNGIGFCLHDNIIGIDLDHIINATGVVSPVAQDIIEKFSTTYIEYSPSGTGVHIFCIGDIKRSGKGTSEKWIEAYDRNSPRYLTVTGERFPIGSSNVTNCQTSLDWLYEKFFTKNHPPNHHFQPPTPPMNFSDYEIISKAQKAKNGNNFNALMSGLWEGRYPSQSEADAALCSILSFWTSDDAQIDRIFRSSSLMREKWDKRHSATGETYGDITIRKNRASNVYVIGSGGQANKQKVEKKQAMELVQIAPVEPPAKITTFPTVPPFEKFSKLTEIIINSAPKKQPELTVANLLAAIGVLLGGKVSTPTDLRTNLYFCAVVGPGRGKDHSRKSTQRLFRLLELEKFCSLKLGTGAGVVKLMDTTPPSKLFMHDEFGLFLKMVGNERTLAPWKEINEVLNDFFSAANDVYHSTATKGGGVVIIKEPCLGIYATSTPDEFYAGLTKTMLSSGMLSRVIFIRGNENATIELEPQPMAIPKNLLTHLRNVANMPYEYKADTISGIKIQCAKRIEFEPAAKQFWNEFRLRMDTLVLKSDQKFASIFARAGEHVAKIALVLSSFELEEAISIEAVRWAALYVENAINLLIGALDEHMAENLNEDNAKRVLALIKRKGGSITKSELVRNTKWLDKQHRDSLLDSLIEGKELILDETPLQNSSKKTSTYILSVDKR